MVVVRDGVAGAPIQWSSWDDWRRGRNEPELVWLRPLSGRELPPTATWCPVCWGNGRLFEMARNGEGPIPVASCHACDGSGVAR